MLTITPSRSTAAMQALRPNGQVWSDFPLSYFIKCHAFAAAGIEAGMFPLGR